MTRPAARLVPRAPARRRKRCPAGSYRLRALALRELVVVLVVLLVLAAAASIVLLRARARRHQRICQQHLAGIYAALQRYLPEHDNRYPLIASLPSLEPRIAATQGREAWPPLPEVLGPYADTMDIFLCPADRVREMRDELPGPRYFDSEGTSYEWRSQMGGWPVGEDPFTNPHGLGRGPADVAIVYDFEPFHRRAGQGNGYNILYLDGSVRPGGVSPADEELP